MHALSREQAIELHGSIILLSVEIAGHKDGLRGIFDRSHNITLPRPPVDLRLQEHLGGAGSFQATSIDSDSTIYRFAMPESEAPEFIPDSIDKAIRKHLGIEDGAFFDSSDSSVEPPQTVYRSDDRGENVIRLERQIPVKPKIELLPDTIYLPSLAKKGDPIFFMNPKLPPEAVKRIGQAVQNGGVLANGKPLTDEYLLAHTANYDVSSIQNIVFIPLEDGCFRMLVARKSYNSDYGEIIDDREPIIFSKGIVGFTNLEASVTHYTQLLEEVCRAADTLRVGLNTIKGFLGRGPGELTNIAIRNRREEPS